MHRKHEGGSLTGKRLCGCIVGMHGFRRCDHMHMFSEPGLPIIWVIGSLFGFASDPARAA